MKQFTNHLLAAMVIAASGSACMQEELPEDETAAELEAVVVPEQPGEPNPGNAEGGRGAFVTPAMEPQQSFANGAYYYIRAKHSNKCLHQHGAVSYNGGAITQWACVDQPNVQWKLDGSPDPDYYYIRVRHSGKCAHQHGGTQGNGDPITQWDCINQPNVKWRIIPAADGYSYIKVQHSGKCMHVHGASSANGTPITQWECISQPNVLWRMDPVGH